MTTPLPKDRDELRRSLIAAGHGGSTLDRLVTQARDTMCLVTEPVDEGTILIGASKFGGAPDLPRNMAWPMRPAYPHAADLARDHEKYAQRTIDDAAKPGY